MIEISSALNTASNKLKAIFEKIKEKLGISRRQKELIDALADQNEGKEISSQKNTPEEMDDFSRSFTQYFERLNSCNTNPLKKKIFENIYNKICDSTDKETMFYEKTFPQIFDYLSDITDLKEDENWYIYGYSKTYKWNVLFSVPETASSLKIPQDINTLAPYSLRNCKLESLTIPENITHIGTHVIIGNTLKHLSIATQKECKLANDAFYWNESLETVDIQSDSFIKAGMFDWCLNLRSISAPKSTITNPFKFYNCHNLTDIKLYYASEDVKEYYSKHYPNLTITTIAPKFTPPQ